MSQSSKLGWQVKLRLSEFNRYTGRSVKIERGVRIDDTLHYRLTDCDGNAYGKPMPLEVLHGYVSGMLVGARTLTEDLRKAALIKLETNG